MGVVCTSCWLKSKTVNTVGESSSARENSLMRKEKALNSPKKKTQQLRYVVAQKMVGSCFQRDTTGGG